jgi:hypothetical protein
MSSVVVYPTSEGRDPKPERNLNAEKNCVSSKSISPLEFFLETFDPDCFNSDFGVQISGFLSLVSFTLPTTTSGVSQRDEKIVNNSGITKVICC